MRAAWKAGQRYGFGIAAGIVLLCVLRAAWASGDEGAKPLEIVLATPKGEVDQLYSIDVCFSAPMVRLGERGEKSAKNVVRFSPGLVGRATWMGTRTLSFVLETPPAPGTAITCTIPKGTKALSGAALESDFSWTIAFRRPRLLASVPAQLVADDAASAAAPEPSPTFPPDDPIVLYFDRAPSSDAAAQVSLRAGSHPIELRAVPATPEILAYVAWQQGEETIDAKRVLVLRPSGTLAAATRHELRIGAGIEFPASSLSLGEPLSIPFETLHAPRVLEVTPEWGGLSLVLATPTFPESLQASLKLEPMPRRLAVDSYDSEGRRFSLSGSFRPGSKVQVSVDERLRDMYGTRLSQPFSAEVSLDHAESYLSIEPWDGALLPGPKEQFAVESLNMRGTLVRVLWLKPGEWPVVSSLLYASGGLLSDAPPALATRFKPRWIRLPEWTAADQQIDSLAVLARRFDELTPRPAGATQLYVEARGKPRFPNPAAEGAEEELTARSLLQFTTLGITSKLGHEHGLLWVTDLESGQPVPNANVSIWPAPDPEAPGTAVPSWTGRTDADGLAWTPGFDALLSRGAPQFAQARVGEREAWLRLSTDWWEERDDSAAGLSAFVFTDRPIYRPGDRVEWKAYVRGSSAKGLAASRERRVVVALSTWVDENARQLNPVDLDVLGNASGAFQLPPEAKTGSYIVAVHLPPAKGQASEAGALGAEIATFGVEVQAYRPPRFEAQVEAHPERLLSGGTLSATGRFHYFNGGPLGAVPVRWFLSLSPTYWRPRGFDEFQFDDDPPVERRPADAASGRSRNRAGGGPDLFQEGSGVLDRDGSIALALPITLPAERGDSRATIEIGARDLADQSAFGRASASVIRGPLRVGVRPVYPEGDAPRTNLLTWEWVVVDTAGTPRAGVPVTAEVYRHEWRTARVRRLGGLFDYENFAWDSLLSTQAMQSQTGAFRHTVQLPGEGLYKLRISLATPEGRGVAAAQQQWLTGPESSPAERPNTYWINLDAEQERYSSGDTARVVIPTPAGGAEALVTLMSGEILRARRVSLKGTPRVEVPLGELAPPDAVIAATLVGPDKVPQQPGTGPRRTFPYHAKGNAWLSIDSAPWRAQVKVTPSTTSLAPGDTLEVSLSLADATGRPLAGEIALAVVDEAVLSLVDAAPLDPVGALFRPRGADTVDDDLRTELRLSPTTGRGKESPGGGGASRSAGLPTRSSFRATAYWNPSIAVGADGQARVRIPMPDDLTRYRLRAVASTVAETFGFAEASVTVTKPLEVEGAAPRFLRVGDRWRLGAVVRNRGPRAEEVEVTAEATGLRLRGANKAKKRLEPGENWRADFEVETPAAGEASYTLEVRAKSGAGDRVRRTLSVSAPVFRETEVTFGVAAPQAREEIDPARPGLAGGNELRVSVAPSLLAGVSESIEYLTDYEHACLEQQDSELLGALARLRLANRLPADGATKTEQEAWIRRRLDSLASMIRDRGFAVWPNVRSGDASPYLNAYTLFTLGRARDASFAVPGDLLPRAEAIVREDLARMRDEKGSRNLQAFLLWTLAETRVTEAVVTDSDLEELASAPDLLDTPGKLCLALAYDAAYRSSKRSKSGSADDRLRRSVDARIDAILDAVAQGLDLTARTASFESTESGPWMSYSSNRDRVRATALGALLVTRHAPNHPLLPALTRWLLDAREHGRWPNTHENAWALLAIEEYAVRAEQLQFPIQARVALGDRRGESARFSADKMQPWVLRTTLGALPGDGKAPVPLRIETDGNQVLYYDVRLDRSFSALSAPARDEGLIVDREYVDAATSKPLARLKRGTPTLVHLALVVPHDSDWLLLEDPLPAGLEAVHLQFRTASRALYASREPMAGDEDPDAKEMGSSEPSDETRLPVTFTDLRDDRARFYCDAVRAGVYHVYYPVTPTTAGSFETPGARAELMYDPEVYGTSGPATLIVE